MALVRESNCLFKSQFYTDKNNSAYLLYMSLIAKYFPHVALTVWEWGRDQWEVNYYGSKVPASIPKILQRKLRVTDLQPPLVSRYLVLSETSIRYLVQTKRSLKSAPVQKVHEQISSMPNGFGQDQTSAPFGMDQISYGCFGQDQMSCKAYPKSKKVKILFRIQNSSLNGESWVKQP